MDTVHDESDAKRLIAGAEQMLKETSGTTRLVRLRVGATTLQPWCLQVEPWETVAEALSRSLREVADEFDAYGRSHMGDDLDD
jgi:hypothetical protein